MKTMTISFLFAAVLAAALFLVVWYLTDSAEAAKGASAFAVTALPSISNWLEQSRARQSVVPGNKTNIQSFNGFAISPWVTVVIGTVVGVAIFNFASFLTGVVAALVKVPATNGLAFESGDVGGLLRKVSLANIPIIMVGFYLLAKWLTWRSRNGIMVVLSVVVLTSIAIKSIDFFFLTSATWQSLFGMEKTVSTLLLLMSGQLVLVLIPSLLGFWRGRREKTSRYMAYLLATLPQETQNSLLDLAYDEVTKIVEARRKATQHATPAAVPA
jgi:hypothetical protein